ncbi:MAG: holo-ACP synthase [Alphaproteobacteria bacterium]|nr:holo-ACP synthase [Alphaproteobacteria bacterium]
MPIQGIGTDMVEVARIEKLLQNKAKRFLEKVFTSAEIKEGASANHYAKRFAAKEACLKALGTGMREGLRWHDMEITNDALGCPHLSLSGEALRLTGTETPRIHVSLSDETHYALAFVIIEG